jgi:hypothetical protein
MDPQPVIQFPVRATLVASLARILKVTEWSGWISGDLGIRGPHCAMSENEAAINRESRNADFKLIFFIMFVFG